MVQLSTLKESVHKLVKSCILPITCDRTLRVIHLCPKPNSGTKNKKHLSAKVAGTKSVKVKLDLSTVLNVGLTTSAITVSTTSKKSMTSS